MDYLNKFLAKSQDIILNLKEELKTFRTGKANPSFVENIIVETYNNTVKLKLKELAAISTLDSTTLQIKPFDLSTIKDIEKAILKSPLGISPKLETDQLIVKFPPLSQEQRKKFVKLINQVVEEGKKNIRKIRDEIRKLIKNSFENKMVSEDERFRLEKQIDEETKKLMEEIDNLKATKEKEILTL